MDHRAFLVIIIWMCGGFSFADDLSLDSLDVLANASLEYQVNESEKEYRLAKSGIKKVNNLWRVDEIKLAGHVTRNTYLLKELLSYQEAEVQLINQLKSSDGLQLIFKCQGLDCGSSSGWANHHFNVKQLYGLDVYQYYSAWQSVGSEFSKIYHVFYLVQRGNKRVYLQHDSVSFTNRDSDSFVSQKAQVLEQLKKYRSVKTLTIPASQLPRQGSSENALLNGADKIAIMDLMQMLTANASLRLRIVGHSYGDAALSDRVKASIEMADHFKSTLLSAGFSAAQLSTHGVGGLAPGGQAYDRVECILESIE